MSVLRVVNINLGKRLFKGLLTLKNTIRALVLRVKKAFKISFSKVYVLKVIKG